MSNPHSQTKRRLAVAGLLGVGAVLGAGFVLPIVRGWATGHAPACSHLTLFTDDDLDRWANEGGCCVLAVRLKE